MPKFRTVEVWSQSGSPDPNWRRAPGEAAFANTSGRVCELYSQGLGLSQIEGPSSLLRMFVSVDGESADVHVSVRVDPGDFESSHIRLPSSVEDLSSEARGLLVLDAVHGTVTRLAQARDWDLAAVEHARDHVLSAGMRFAWDGPWKCSPDRKHEARASYQLDDDGEGRIVIQARARGTEAPLSVSDEIRGFRSARDFKSNAKLLRWRDSGTLSLVVFPGWRESPARGLTLALATAQPFAAAPDTTPSIDPLAQRPNVVVTGRGATAPEQRHQIRYIGGGPTNGVSRQYSAVITTLIDAVARDGAQWWSASDVALLKVTCWHMGDTPKVTASRTENQMTVTIKRSAASIKQPPGPVATARADVEAVLAIVTRRLKLGPPPALPDVTAEQLADAIEADRKQDLLVNRVELLLDAIRGLLAPETLAQVDRNMAGGTIGSPIYSGVLSTIARAQSEGQIALSPEQAAEVGALYRATANHELS